MRLIKSCTNVTLDDQSWTWNCQGWFILFFNDILCLNLQWLAHVGVGLCFIVVHDSFCLYLSVIEARVVKWAFRLETRFRELSLSCRSVEVKVYPALKRCLLQFDNTCLQFWDVFIARSHNTVDFSLCSVQKLDWLALCFAKRFFLDVRFLWWSSATLTLQKSLLIQILWLFPPVFQHSSLCLRLWWIWSI